MNSISLPTKRPFNWKVFLFVLALIIPATYAIIPFTMTLTSATLEMEELPLLTILTLVNALIYGGLAGIGLFLAGRIGLGLPFVEGWLKKEPVWKRFRKVLVFSVIVGFVVGLTVIGLDVLVFNPPIRAELERLDIITPKSIRPPAWQGFLASFSAGVTEEVIFRLFGLTLLAWLGSRVRRDSEGRPTIAVLWIANIVFAVAFGLAHLPAAAAIGLPLSPLVVTRAIVLNGIGGLVLVGFTGRKVWRVLCFPTFPLTLYCMYCWY